MSDLYVVVKLRATSEEIRVDPHELADARWMSRAAIEAIVADATLPAGASLDGKVSANMWKVIQLALDGPTIHGETIGGHRPAMLYTAAPANKL